MGEYKKIEESTEMVVLSPDVLTAPLTQTSVLNGRMAMFRLQSSVSNGGTGQIDGPSFSEHYVDLS